MTQMIQECQISGCTWTCQKLRRKVLTGYTFVVADGLLSEDSA